MSLTRPCKRCRNGVETCAVGDCWICDTCDQVDPDRTPVPSVDEYDPDWDLVDWGDITRDESLYSAIVHIWHCEHMGIESSHDRCNIYRDKQGRWKLECYFCDFECVVRNSTMQTYKQRYQVP